MILGDLNGVGISTLIEKENSIIDIDFLLNELPKVKQFDWADFFLFKDYPQEWKTNTDLPYTEYPPLIDQTDTTIRAVDDQYIYIYTYIDEIVNIIKKNYEIESIKMSSLDNLEYPY